MATTSLRIAIVGAGIFGVTASLALKRKGHQVTLLDPGPLPHPLAESTDISKVVRIDYGADQDYTIMMEQAIEGWRRWNTTFPLPLYHETGVVFLCRAPMAQGGFEYDSFELLTQRGHKLERMDSAQLTKRFPAWRADTYTDGYFNPVGGYAESGKVVEQLIHQAQQAGVQLIPNQRVTGLADKGSRVTGVVMASGDTLDADWVVVTAGSWTPHLLPFMAPHFKSVGQPIFHLAPADPSQYKAKNFPVFGADISKTGYYGFPINASGIVKVANHGVGRKMHPESADRSVTGDEQLKLRQFLTGAFPGLTNARIAFNRVCVYCDTYDEHFWIARDPGREGLVVATGGSGHAFKFAPMLGDLIADAVLGEANPWLNKFRWRPEIRPDYGEEAARHHG